MKRWTVLILCLSLLASLCACGRKYKLYDVPKALQLDPSSLSENTDEMLSVTDRTPLIAALPEEELYVYESDPTIVDGVLVKYDGMIQYFAWPIVPQIAEPEVCMADYNGDGRQDIAFTYCETASEIKHNENLHILLRGEKGFTDCAYTWQSAAVDASMGIVIDDNGDGTFTAHMNGQAVTAATDAASFGEYKGIYANDVQDFTLGETITLTVKPGLVFAERSLPVYDVFTYKAVMQLSDEMLRPVDATLIAS